MTRDGRLGVGVIGGGRLGPVLAAGLAGAGHAIVGLEAETDRDRDRVTALIRGAPVLDRATVIERSELVIVDVDNPATELGPLLERVTAERSWVQGQLVLHTAPQFGTAPLGPALDAGVIPLAVHPAIAVTGTSLDLARLREAWCAVTAPRPVLPIAQALVVELGAEPVVIAEEHRATYAEAIATATEFTNSIVQQAVSLLTEIGVDQPGFVLSSLVRSAADNALADSTPPTLEVPEA
ncbi:hypothetical protein GCM10011490_22400 [Pseudoclavibacter endophyticus]|uniref:DUF2520 domain-containing protein n=1 Tax=Pseudoclavibacter endophyticus TaxID=1778590 RepID=A0A6H9WNS7_9MICO|nr:DUF2520 domain-containing protein [Pseudoclavibacter endophyticus]KAB1648276.1 DUF2520 domain-containing protein [Pseudoclavibacter endophyticus]GGA71241.1 hypothetical protein GCM10011490_22400 [Pseudoclavibacter endophyticus]